MPATCLQATQVLGCRICESSLDLDREFKIFLHQKSPNICIEGLCRVRRNGKLPGEAHFKQNYA